MVNPAADGYQGEQFIRDVEERDRRAKRQELLDPRGAITGGGVGGGSPLRRSAADVAFGSPGRLDRPIGGWPGSSGLLPEEERMHILQREHHKSERVSNLQQVLSDIEDDDIPKVRLWAMGRCERRVRGG